MEHLKFEKINDSEKELSLEVIEKIMEGVQDINQEGTGVHAIAEHGKYNDLTNLDLLSKMLESGLLARPKDIDQKLVAKDEWVKQIRKRPNKFVFFNIVGRDINSVGESEWMMPGKHPNPIALSLNISSFNEDKEAYRRSSGAKGYEGGDTPFQIKTFGPHGHTEQKGVRYHDIKIHIGRGGYKEIPLLVPMPNMGYALSYRIAPRFFKGVVFRSDRKSTEEELRDMWSKKMEKYKTVGRTDRFAPYEERVFRDQHKYVEDTHEEVKEKRAKEIYAVMQEACKGKAKNLLPIYDIHGNLYWPKKMTYKEVKKFVAERNAKKEEAR